MRKHQLIALILFYLFLYCGQAMAGQITFVITGLPDYHNSNDSIYLAGTINGWTTANPHFKFKTNSQGQLSLTVPMKNVGDKLQFKLTRGTWETVELDAQRYDKGNRTYTYRGGRYQELISIAHWKDKVSSKGLKSTIAGDVRIFTDKLKYQGEYRTIRVLLPSDYQHAQNSTRRYSVLYMFDGQNLFDKATASVGMEWRIDELLTELSKKKSSNSVIVVGIDSLTVCDRFNEYTGWQWQAKDCGTVKGEGAFMSAFVVNQVKPFIDETFRTQKDRQSTYIGGSSLGGYMAIYTGIHYQYTFSKVLGLSNAVLDKYTGDRLRERILALKMQQPIDFYLDIGSQEAVSQSNRSDLLIDSNQKMAEAIRQAGFDANSVTFKVIEGGVHDENSWSERFVEVLEQLKIIK